MISAHIYRGRSQHPVLQSWERVLYAVEIFYEVTQLPWWKRWWRQLPSMVEPFANMAWEFYLLEKGQLMLAEVRPEGGFLDFARLEQHQAWLNDQIRSSGSVGRKTQRPSETARWPDNVFYKQYLFEINEHGQLLNLFDRFRGFEMMNIFVLNVDAKPDECAHQLQLGVLDKSFDLGGIIESLNAFIYCSSLGDKLVIESPHEILIERFLGAHHIEPVPVSIHPLAIKTSRSLWLGKRRLLP